MKSRRFVSIIPCIASLFISTVLGQAQDRAIPHLEKRDNGTKLIVDGQPFICLSGELSNSSSSGYEYMKTVWPRLAKANLNTVIGVLTWDMIEPEEGKFDFSLIDQQIEGARQNHLHLVLLWLASWKNSNSTYPPEWVKTNRERFPFVRNKGGRSLQILSTFTAASRDADAKAFAAVMKHIREVDGTQHTVLMMQVENEVGVLGDSRDRSPAANEAFAKPVPKELTDYLQQNKDKLLPELRKVWDAAGNKTSGMWEEVFGKNNASPPEGEIANYTDEIFMAWNYSQYIGAVAAAGKKEYPIPMYCNTWLVQPNDAGPGDYPSGGPEPRVQDVWRAGAPGIDILAPDIYLPDFVGITTTFSRGGNPLFIPEASQSAANAWIAVMQQNTIGYSPFGIDRVDPEGPLAWMYGMLGSLTPVIAENQGKLTMKLVTMEQGTTSQKVEIGNYIVNLSAGGGRRGGGGGGRFGRAVAPASAPAEAPVVNPFAAGRGGRGGRGGGYGFGPGQTAPQAPYALIIASGPNEYYFAGNGLTVTFSSKQPNTIASLAIVEQGAFQNGKWERTRRLNGDETQIDGTGPDGTSIRSYRFSELAAMNVAGTGFRLGGGFGGARGAAPAGDVPTAPPAPTVMKVRVFEYR